MSGLAAMRGARFWIRAGSSVLALAIIFAGWYRWVYNVWPGQGADARVHWCGRIYEDPGGPAQSWRQISSQSQSPLPVHVVGLYPPLGWSRQGLFASVAPPPSAICTTAVFLRIGPDGYRAYTLLGGP